MLLTFFRFQGNLEKSKWIAPRIAHQDVSFVRSATYLPFRTAHG